MGMEVIGTELLAGRGERRSLSGPEEESRSSPGPRPSYCREPLSQCCNKGLSISGHSRDDPKKHCEKG